MTPTTTDDTTEREEGERVRPNRRRNKDSDYDYLRRDIRGIGRYYLVELTQGRWYGMYKGKAEAVKNKKFAHRFHSPEPAERLRSTDWLLKRYQQAKVVVWFMT